MEIHNTFVSNKNLGRSFKFRKSKSTPNAILTLTNVTNTIRRVFCDVFDKKST
jgi:hypothetical protein